MPAYVDCADANVLSPWVTLWPGINVPPVAIRSLSAITLKCLALLSVTALQGQQLPTIRVPVRLVSVPTLVLSKDGRVVDSLQQTNFQLYDNDLLQNVKLETGRLPLSVALVVQANDDVREYLPLISKVGSVVDTMLVAQTGQAAVITYNDEVTILKPFDSADVESALQKPSPNGQSARLVDAGLEAVALLKAQPAPRSRVLLFIGQAADHGSNNQLVDLEQKAESENVSIYALALPQFGKSFISDSFGLRGFGSQFYKGGYEANVKLNRLLPALNRSAQATAARDPFSLLTSASGGVQLSFRKQSQLENALFLIGEELRSLYILTYSPNSLAPGHHKIKIGVDIANASVFSRPGYTLAGN